MQRYSNSSYNLSKGSVGDGKAGKKSSVILLCSPA
jgi:hypothetical protein